MTRRRDGRRQGTPFPRRDVRLSASEFIDLWRRLWPKLVPNGNGCWDWTGYRCKSGYGRISVQGRSMLVTRAVLLLTGRFDVDLDACHECDRPPCGRPSHLRPDTAEGNAADRTSREGIYC